MNAMDQCKVNVMPVTYFERDPLRSYFDERPKNEIYFLSGFLVSPMKTGPTGMNDDIQKMQILSADS